MRLIEILRSRGKLQKLTVLLNCSQHLQGFANIRQRGKKCQNMQIPFHGLLKSYWSLRFHFLHMHACLCVCVWATGCDSVLNGSWSHMATCQQAGGGNIIPRRKVAVISACMLVWESALGSTRHITSLTLALSPSLFSFFFSLSCFFFLCLFSTCTLIQPQVCLFTAEFRIALQCLRWLLCSKHTKVWYNQWSICVSWTVA